MANAKCCSKKILSFEIYLIIYSLACVVINTAYEQTLKSHLTIVKEPKPLETLEEMAIETTGDIVFPAKTLNDFRNILESSPIMKLRTLEADRNVVPMRTSYAEVHKETLQGHVVINSEFFERYEIIMQLSYKDKTTDMQIIPQWFTHYYYVFQMPRMSRFEALINKRLFQLRESGLLTELLQRVLDKAEPTPLDEHSEDHEDHDMSQKPLKLDMYILLFIAYFAGFLAALIAFVIEYNW